MEFSKTPEIIKDIDLIADYVPIDVLLALLYCMDGQDIRRIEYKIHCTSCNAIRFKPIQVEDVEIDLKDTH